MNAIASLAMINIDSTDPRAAAEFYSKILDLPVTHSQAEYAMISNDATAIGFGLVEGLTPPQWPDPSSPKRFHLDLMVDDLEKSEALCLELGATRPDFQPGEDRWRVLLDLDGQPFCICRKP